MPTKKQYEVCGLSRNWILREIPRPYLFVTAKQTKVSLILTDPQTFIYIGDEMLSNIRDYYYRVRWWVVDWVHPRSLKRLYQYLTRGFSDRQLWSLDYTMSKFLLPRLREFRKNLHGHPSGLKSLEEWDEILGKIQIALEYHLKDGEDLDSGIDVTSVTFSENGVMKIKKDEEKWELFMEEMARREKITQDGLELLAKHYRNLWD